MTGATVARDMLPPQIIKRGGALSAPPIQAQLIGHCVSLSRRDGTQDGIEVAAVHIVGDAAEFSTAKTARDRVADIGGETSRAGEQLSLLDCF